MTASDRAERARLKASTERVDEFLAAEAGINADPDLSPEQKREKIEELRTQLLGQVSD